VVTDLLRQTVLNRDSIYIELMDGEEYAMNRTHTLLDKTAARILI
jgi:hypothetical protein